MIFWRPSSFRTFDEGFAAGHRLPVLGHALLPIVIAPPGRRGGPSTRWGSIIVIAIFNLPARRCPPDDKIRLSCRSGCMWLSPPCRRCWANCAGAATGRVWLGYANAVSAAGMIAYCLGSHPRAGVPCRPAPPPRGHRRGGLRRVAPGFSPGKGAHRRICNDIPMTRSPNNPKPQGAKNKLAAT